MTGMKYRKRKEKGHISVLHMFVSPAADSSGEVHTQLEIWVGWVVPW